MMNLQLERERRKKGSEDEEEGEERVDEDREVKRRAGEKGQDRDSLWTNHLWG